MAYYIREVYYSATGRKHHINYSERFATKNAAIERILSFMHGDQEIMELDEATRASVEMRTCAYAIVHVADDHIALPKFNNNLSILL